MPYLIDSARDVIFVRHFGIITEQELDQIHDRLVDLTIGSGKNARSVLIDTRDATWLPSVTDFFLSIDRASKTKTYGKTAVVFASKHRETAEFIETTCRNREMRIRVFYDPDSAMAWLRDSSSGPATLEDSLLRG